MKLGMISPTHNAAGIERIKALGLDYAEFDVNADDISYLDRAEIRKALADTGVKLGAVGRWGRDRITSDGSINAKEQNFMHKCPIALGMVTVNTYIFIQIE